jgi:hypothetical protein
MRFTAADAEVDRPTTLLIESVGEGSLVSTAQGLYEVEAALTRSGYNFDVVNTDVFAHLDLSTYSTIVAAISRTSGVAASALTTLHEHAANGNRVIILGGVGSSSFVQGMDVFTSTTGQYGLKTSAHDPDMRVVLWDAGHPLAAGLNESIVFESPSVAQYAVRVNDLSMRVAYRNADGFPVLMGKAVGNHGGVFVYFAYNVEDVSESNPEDEDVLRQVVSNSMNFTAADAEVDRPTTLLIESIGEGSLVSTAQGLYEVEAALTRSGYNFDVVNTDDFAHLDLSAYSTIVTAISTSLVETGLP